MKTLPALGRHLRSQPERLENSFHSRGRRPEIPPSAWNSARRGDVVRWRMKSSAKHHDREVILLTHAFIYYNDTRYDWKKFGQKHKRGNPIPTPSLARARTTSTTARSCGQAHLKH